MSSVLQRQDHWYDSVSEFVNGLAIATRNGKQFHINELDEPIYESRYDRVYHFCGDFALVFHGLKFFHIRLDGRPAYSERYLAATGFNKGQSHVLSQDCVEFVLKSDLRRAELSSFGAGSGYLPSRFG